MRKPKGNPNRKLTAEQVLEARELFKVRQRRHSHQAPLMMKDLANRWGVSRSTLHRAAMGFTYKRVGVG